MVTALQDDELCALEEKNEKNIPIVESKYVEVVTFLSALFLLAFQWSHIFIFMKKQNKCQN